MSDKPVIYLINHTLYYTHRRAIEQMIAEGKNVAVMLPDQEWDRHNFVAGEFTNTQTRRVWLVDTITESDLTFIQNQKSFRTGKETDHYTIVEMGDDY